MTQALRVFNWLIAGPLCLLVASPSVAQSQASASLTIEVIAESVAPRGTKYKITQYANEQCAKRGKTDRLLRKRSVKGRHVFQALDVDTSKNFIFQVMFEQKKLRQLKSCSSIANVGLEAGRDYKAVYTVSGEVLGCSLKVYDFTDTQTATEIVNSGDEVGPESLNSMPIEVNYDAPEFTCLKINKPGFKNNVPVHSALDLEL